MFVRSVDIFISLLKGNPRQRLQRSHWGIENMSHLLYPPVQYSEQGDSISLEKLQEHKNYICSFKFKIFKLHPSEQVYI